MFWVGVGIGALVVLVLVAALAGSLLPKGHVASVRVRVAKPPAEVWGAIRDFASWPSWNPGVKRMERLPDAGGAERWMLHESMGGFPSRVEVSEPPAEGRAGRLVTRIDDPKLPFGGAWTWTVEPDGAGSAVTITEDGEIRNPVFRLLARFVIGYHGTAERFLAALARRDGTEVVPERVK